jgi:CheY-like chemotaxis protein
MTRLLIVDDSASMRGLMKSMVAGMTTAIHECSDGVEALASYERFHPDLVFMDVEMAEMDGLTATRQIVAAHPEARIVIVTKYGTERLREAARRAGACGFVSKENLMELRELIAGEAPQGH